MNTFFAKTNYYRFPVLREIFNKDNTGNTTDTSIYYQRIIQYFLNDVQSYYTLRDVVNPILHLLPLRTKNKKKNYDLNKDKNKIVESKEKTLTNYFSNLVSWQILSKRPIKMKTGTGDTFEYKITKFGQLLALLIDTEFNKSNMSFDALYSFLKVYFNQEPSSLDYFCKVYLNRCKESGLFEIFIEHLRKNMLYQNNYIENDNDLFTSMVFMTTFDKQLNVKLWKLWNESYNDLSYESQELFLYHLKLALDRRIGETVVSYGPYESMLFESKYEYYTITIEYR